VAGETLLIGCTGVLSVATRGPAGPGEVIVKIRGGSETYLAWSPTPLPKGATVPVRGMKVVKVGRTTNKTTGTVRDVHFRFALDYDDLGKSVGFLDQVFCTRYSKPGDSGSLVLSQANKKADLPRSS